MATITRENISLLNDKITVNVSKDDYLPSFEKALKEYGKKANIPGFRKGMSCLWRGQEKSAATLFADEVLPVWKKELTNYLMSAEKLGGLTAAPACLKNKFYARSTHFQQNQDVGFL